jgi:hypothetical protein
MARGTQQSGYAAGLTQGSGTGPVNPVAMPQPDVQATGGVDQLIKTIFPIANPIVSPPMQSGGPTPLGDPSPSPGQIINYGQPAIKPTVQPRPVNRPRMFGGGQNPFFK